jgi:type I restriction enzyme S subunit
VDQRSQFGIETHLSMSQRLGLVPSSMVEQRTLVSESYAGGKLCACGDLVLNRLKAHLGVFARARQAGVISPDYTVLRPRKEIAPQYFEELLRSPICRSEFRARAKGIVEGFWRLYTDDFYNIRLPFPPLAEQAAIVRFLNHADRRIRLYIHAKQRLIKLLEEQKQAIIHCAATQGLDPNVRLKPSGVEWLGDVPEHWAVRRLKDVTTPLEQGWSPQCDAQPAGDGEWGVLKVGCVNKDQFEPNQNKRLPSEQSAPPNLQVRDGDILVSRANTRELVGLAAVVVEPRERLLLCDKLFRFRARPESADSWFLVSAIRSQKSRAQIESKTNGASDSMQNIGQMVVQDLVLALPPLAEQHAISSAIRKQLQNHAIATSTTRRELSFLYEYRTRLIADVVTGKLDIRAAALPNEVEDVDPLDDVEALAIDAADEGDETKESDDA